MKTAARERKSFIIIIILFFLFQERKSHPFSANRDHSQLEKSKNEV